MSMRYTRRPCRAGTAGHSGVTILDVLVGVVVLIGLAGLFLVYAAKKRGEGGRIVCASNLRDIAQHAFIYSNADPRNGGRYPRTYYDPAAPLDWSLAGNTAGAAAFDVARPTAPVGANNTQAAFYLLVRTTELKADVFRCDSAEAGLAYGGENLAAYANWPAPYAAFNSYSYNCPYPTAAAVAGGWRFDNSLGPDYPLAADINPGGTPAGGPTTVAYTAGRKAMQQGNSPNHAFEGQQVAYCDAHVEWQTSPFVGVPREGVAYRDNIYASTAGGVAADGVGGTVWEKPQDAADAVMLPTARESLGSATAARTVGAVPTPVRRRAVTEAERLLVVPVGAAAALCALMGGRMIAKRRRRARAAAVPTPATPHPRSDG